MAVAVETGESFRQSSPELLFMGRYDRDASGAGAVPNYDVSSDGQQFLMLKAPETSDRADTEVILVQNWFEELKRLVPVD